MTREEHLKFCSLCTNRTFNPKHGIVCSITDKIASFTSTCPDYAEDELQRKIEDQNVDHNKKEAKRGINKGRYTLFIIGVLYIVAGFLEAFFIDGHDLLFGIVDWVVASIFIGLGIWSYWKAYLALIIGLGFYILLIVLLAAVDPTYIIKGIIWKIVIILTLLYSIKTARSERTTSAPKSDDLLDQI